MTQFIKIKVLIAHGDPLIAAGLAATLREHRDFEARVFSPASKLSSAAASDLPPADVVVADYDSGMRLIVSAGAGSHRVVILTHGDGEARICRALEHGARGYLLLSAGGFSQRSVTQSSTRRRPRFTRRRHDRPRSGRRCGNDDFRKFLGCNSGVVKRGPPACI